MAAVGVTDVAVLYKCCLFGARLDIGLQTDAFLKSRPQKWPLSYSVGYAWGAGECLLEIAFHALQRATDASGTLNYTGFDHTVQQSYDKIFVHTGRSVLDFKPFCGYSAVEPFFRSQSNHDLAFFFVQIYDVCGRSYRS